MAFTYDQLHGRCLTYQFAKWPWKNTLAKLFPNLSGVMTLLTGNRNDVFRNIKSLQLWPYRLWIHRSPVDHSPKGHQCAKNSHVIMSPCISCNALTHWCRVTHICVSKLTIIGSDNGLSPGRRQAIIWTNAGISWTGPLRTNVSEILIKIHTFSFKKMHLELSSGKWWPFYLAPNMLRPDINGPFTCMAVPRRAMVTRYIVTCNMWHCMSAKTGI